MVPQHERDTLPAFSQEKYTLEDHVGEIYLHRTENTENRVYTEDFEQ